MGRKSSVVTLAVVFIPLLLIYFVTVVFLQLHHNGGSGGRGGAEMLKVAVKRSNNADSNNIYQVIESAEDTREGKNEIIDCSEQLLFGEFNGITLNTFNKDEIEFSIQQQCLNGQEKCPPPSYLGLLKVKIDTSIDVYNNRLNYVNFGGWWSPMYCLVEKAQQVAIIIPYSNDDDDHLGILLNHLHPVLKRQQLHYRIFVVKHKDPKRKFCKGRLMNAGFLEVNKLFPYTCFVFHDVDLLPLNDRVNYACNANSPMQLSVLIDDDDGDTNDGDRKNDGKYDGDNTSAKSYNLFGRVVSFKPRDFKKLQGFPNNYCSNDIQADESILYKHLADKKLKFVKESFDHGRFTKLKHMTGHASNARRRINIRRPTLDTTVSPASHDDNDGGGGLEKISYELSKVEKRHYYTLITLDEVSSNTFNFNRL